MGEGLWHVYLSATNSQRWTSTLTVLYPGTTVLSQYQQHPQYLIARNYECIDNMSERWQQPTTHHRSLHWPVSRGITVTSHERQSTLVQAMAWCRQAPSHCLTQCSPRSMSSYGITRPCLKSPATGWFVQPFVEPTSQKTSNPHYCLFCWGIPWSPVDSPQKGPVTRKTFPNHDIIMGNIPLCLNHTCHARVTTIWLINVCPAS